jgi:hypothetical protein
VIYIFLVLLLPSWLNLPVDSSRMACMSSSSAIDLARVSSKNRASTTSLFFLGLPLLRGICCCGDKASTIFPSYASHSASCFMWFDLVFYVGKGLTPFTSLGMAVVGENDTQSFWGLDLEIMLLHLPFLMIWEVPMA